MNNNKMIIEYSRLRKLSTKDRLNSTLTINYNKNSKTILNRGLVRFDIDFDDSDNLMDKIMRYAKFKNEYYILSLEKDRMILYFGLKKISGTKMYLIEKETHNNDTARVSEQTLLLTSKLLNENMHTHIGFISDDYKLFFLEEKWSNHKNENLKALSPTNIENPISFK